MADADVNDFALLDLILVSSKKKTDKEKNHRVKAPNPKPLINSRMFQNNAIKIRRTAKATFNFSGVLVIPSATSNPIEITRNGIPRHEATLGAGSAVKISPKTDKLAKVRPVHT
jgi:hypothetical protein